MFLFAAVAVLGILLVNIWAYGLAFPAALNPNMLGLESGADRLVYALVFMVALNKTMPIFYILFVAGMVLGLGTGLIASAFGCELYTPPNSTPAPSAPSVRRRAGRTNASAVLTGWNRRIATRWGKTT